MTSCRPYLLTSWIGSLIACWHPAAQRCILCAVIMAAATIVHHNHSTTAWHMQSPTDPTPCPHHH
jgi:hypothetical protein